MTDVSSSPQPSRVRKIKEYDDPHYHDEEPEIPADDRQRRPGTNAEARKQAMRKLASRKRSHD